MLLLIVFSLYLLSAYFVGLQDYEMFRNKYKEQEAWKNKYTQIDGKLLPPKDNWYYKKFNIKHEEKFLFSATLFSFLSDRWHLYKFISVISNRLMVSLLMSFVIIKLWNVPSWVNSLIFLVVFTLLWMTGFHLGYTWKKKSPSKSLGTVV